MFCSELFDRILLLYIENLQMIYFCARGNFSFSIVKQQHHGRFPPGRVSVPLAKRIPYPTNSIQFCSIVHIKKIHGEKTNHQRRKSTISFQQLLFQLSYSAEKTKKAAGQLSKKPKRLRHQIEKYVIEKSIKRAQNKDVRKSQRKS